MIPAQPSTALTFRPTSQQLAEKCKAARRRAKISGYGTVGCLVGIPILALLIGPAASGLVLSAYACLVVWGHERYAAKRLEEAWDKELGREVREFIYPCRCDCCSVCLG